MTALASQEKWETTLRWDSVDVLFKLRATENREYALNPTHEEVVTTLMKNWIQSYKDLECMSVYQFQTKFRNEKRAKSGILRRRWKNSQPYRAHAGARCQPVARRASASTAPSPHQQF